MFKEGDKIICTYAESDCWYKVGDRLVVRGDSFWSVRDEGDVVRVYDGEEHHLKGLTNNDHAWVLCKDFTLDSSAKEVCTTHPLKPEYTGGSSNYYKVFVNNPVTAAVPYEAECLDIIEALGMTFAEGNAFKAIWRKAKARQGVQKKGYDNGVYDSEKVVFFGERMLVEAKANANSCSWLGKCL